MSQAPFNAADTSLADKQKQVLRQFRIVFNAVKTHFRNVEKQLGIGGAQLWALSIILEAPGLGTSELAARMDIHQSTASNLVRALVEQGLVQTTKSEVDRRAVTLKCTPDGATLVGKAPAPFAGVLPDVLSRLDAPTLQRLHDDLGAVIALLSSDEQAAKTPLGQ